MKQIIKKAMQYLDEFNQKKIGILAAGVAFFTTLAFFPAIAAAVAISTFFIGDSNLKAVVEALHTYLPPEMAAMVSAQLQMESGNHAGNLVIATIGILVALFSASGAVSNLTTALNAAYDVEENRNFIKVKLISIALTLGAVITGIVSILLLVIRPEYLENLGVPGLFTSLLPYARWVIILMIVCLSLEVLYRYGVNRKKRRFRFFTLGTVIATLLWMAATVLFFVYAQYFAGFSRSYSVFAGMVVLMLWLNLSSLAVLVGAMINAHQQKH
jgi:membrane protein